jgi:hypothetical protein
MQEIIIKKIPGEDVVLIGVPAYPTTTSIMYDPEITAFCGSCDHLGANLYCVLKHIVDHQEMLIRAGICISATKNGQPGVMTKSGFSPK